VGPCLPACAFPLIPDSGGGGGGHILMKMLAKNHRSTFLKTLVLLVAATAMEELCWQWLWDRLVPLALITRIYCARFDEPCELNEPPNGHDEQHHSIDSYSHLKPLTDK
jgi:hypothetical protein